MSGSHRAVYRHGNLQQQVADRLAAVEPESDDAGRSVDSGGVGSGDRTPGAGDGTTVGVVGIGRIAGPCRGSIWRRPRGADPDLGDGPDDGGDQRSVGRALAAGGDYFPQRREHPAT